MYIHSSSHSFSPTWIQSARRHLQNLQRAKGIRENRNTQITDAEIDLLIEGHRKLDSTIINVVSARLQQVTEESGGARNWCVFSSWLGPLVAGIVKEGKYAGTILEHVQTAICEQEVLEMSCCHRTAPGPGWTRTRTTGKDFVDHPLVLTEKTQTLGRDLDRLQQLQDRDIW